MLRVGSIKELGNLLLAKYAREHRDAIDVACGTQREANEKIITLNLSMGLIEDVETPCRSRRGNAF